MRAPAPLASVRIPLAALAGLALTACVAEPPIAPVAPPEIAISGVEDGGRYTEPVRIEISVAPPGASHEATLNGEPFASGETVSRPGDHLLRVEAHHRGEVAIAELAFTIEATGERVLILRMLDLGPEGLGGGGDALLLTDSSAAGMWHGMVDAGPGTRAGALDSTVVADHLDRLGVDTLEFLQLTHAHVDHFGGMKPVLDRVHVRRFLYNGQPRTFWRYQTTLARAEQRADSVFVVMSEWDHTLGAGAGATRTVHLPGLPRYLAEDTGDGRRLNEGSIGTYVEHGGVRIFLTGDGEVEANARWRTDFAGYTGAIDVLKVGHHGANNAVFDDGTGFTSTASAWLDHTRPGLTLISANGVTHPRSRALARLLGLTGTETYCTPVHGTVAVRVYPSGLWRVAVERSEGEDCVPGEEATT